MRISCLLKWDWFLFVVFTFQVPALVSVVLGMVGFHLKREIMNYFESELSLYHNKVMFIYEYTSHLLNTDDSFPFDAEKLSESLHQCEEISEGSFFYPIDPYYKAPVSYKEMSYKMIFNDSKLEVRDVEQVPFH